MDYYLFSVEKVYETEAEVVGSDWPTFYFY